MLQTTDYPLFALFATLFGFGMGGIVPLHGAIAGQVFGRENFGKVMGLMRPAMMPLQITGLPALLGGYLTALWGLRSGFQVFLVLYGVSALCASALRIEKSTARERVAMAGSGSTLRRRVLLGSALLGGFFWIFGTAGGSTLRCWPSSCLAQALLVLACAVPAALVGWLLARWRR